MTARLFTVTFLLFLTTAIRSAGQEIVHLGVDKGLSNGYVTAIAEDGNNNIWVATEEGLNRWDGKRFHKYMPGNSALTDPELSSLICLEDDKDHVWVGSQRNGIFCVDLQGYKISKIDRGFRTRDIAALTPGRNGGMWITHYHFGPQFYDPVRDVLHPSVSGRTPGLPTLSWTTYEAADGRLYIGHVDQGLSVVDTLTHTFRNYRYPELPGNTVYAITGDELGNIWIGTDHGAAFFNPTTGEIKKIEHDHCNPASIRPGNVRSIVAGDNGTLWFATSQGGVSVLNIKEVMTNGIDSARFTSLPYNNAPGGTAGSFIRCILRDSYGNMWIGNYNRGVDFHSHKPSIITRVNYFKENRRERYLPVMSASATRDGSVWIGSDPDMALISSKGEVLRRVPLTYDGKRLTSYVRCVYADEEYGRVWAGTNEEGLYIYRPADGSVAKADMPLTNMRSVKVFGDSVYVSTDVGIYSISRQGTQAVPCTAFNDSLEDKIVNDFEIDRRGLYWVATFGKGLYVFGPDRSPIAHFSDATGFPSNRVNAIVHDSRGNTWAATMRGLVRFNGNDINDYHKVESIDRLDISHINSVCEGAGGRIWFATNNSLGYVNPVDEEASLFLSNDATPMHSFIAGVSYADNDGVISFPSINGLIRVNSRAVDSFDEPLDVHVTSFVSFSEDSSAKGLEQMLGDGTVRLRHDENDFTVTFSIPDYAHMLYAEFSYRLDGFDDNWHEILGDNTVSFHSIQPGEYKLQVRRRSDGDSWSLPQQVLTVIIEPSPWLTWWAKLIYVLLALAFCAVVAYLLKHRIDARRLYLQEKEHSRNAQELNEERLRFYTNVTHELRTPLTLIMGPLEDLVSDPSLPSKYAYKLRMMRSNAESLLTLINGILEFRKTETLNRQLTVRRGPVANLVREIGLRFKESTQNQKLRFVFDIEDNSPEIYYDNDIVTIVLNNLLSNAVKYTPEGEIRLSLHTVSDDKGVRRTVIAVSDTGYGISGKALNLIFQRYFQANGEHQASGTGIGLALVKNLADLHHATIEVQSVEGKGSTFSLSLLTDESYPEALHFDEPQAGVEDRGAGYEVADDIQCVDGQENTPPERRRILVVEDNADIREYIRLTLQEEAEVSTAVNGLDGLEKAFSIIPDLIISDIMMPEMDGVTMCRQLKGEEVTSHIPIVLLTAKDSLTDKEEGYESGADSYLTKPFSAKLLRSRIHNILMTRKRLAAYLMSRSEGHVISDEETVTPDEEEKKIVEQSLSPLDAHFLEKLNNILSDNIADDALNVTLLADKMCMSNSTLYRKLMSLLGVSPNEYIRRLRLKHATELLNKRELSIEEIAFRTGFGSYNTFSKVFKKEFGLSPTEYIKKNIVKQTGG